MYFPILYLPTLLLVFWGESSFTFEIIFLINSEGGKFENLGGEGKAEVNLINIRHIRPIY